MIPVDSCILDSEKIIPKARIYMNDWNETQDGTPPELAGDYKSLSVDASDEDKEIYRVVFRETKV